MARSNGNINHKRKIGERLNELRQEYNETLSRIQKYERNVEGILRTASNLETKLENMILKYK